ncbi:hypothetical protein L7F22_040532 [Adiantum nelumboides]|nr:hypothetical protein [Adiantum nelumboides]
MDSSELFEGILQSLNIRELEVSDPSTQPLKVCVFHLPSIVSTEELVGFLESKIRDGAVAQCLLRTDRKKMALVQFMTRQDARRAIELSRKGCLAFKGSLLKVYPDKKPHKRDDGMTTLGDVVLHAGCLTQQEVLHKLWTCYNCKIEVENTRKRFCIIISGSSQKTYKLEWHFREIFEFCHCKRRYSCTGQAYILRVWPNIF